MINKKIIYIFIPLFLLLLITELYLLTKNEKIPKLAVSSIFPSPNSKNVDFYPEITITIDNKPEYLNLIDINGNPPAEFNRKVVEKSVIFTPIKALRAETEYEISVYQKDVAEPLIQWSFTTQVSPSNLDVVEKIQEVNDKYYPLLKYLPPDSKNFKAYYTDRLVLHVMIFSKNVEAVKQEVLSWIRSKNIDPSTHKFEWVEMTK